MYIYLHTYYLYSWQKKCKGNNTYRAGLLCFSLLHLFTNDLKTFRLKIKKTKNIKNYVKRKIRLKQGFENGKQSVRDTKNWGISNYILQRKQADQEADWKKRLILLDSIRMSLMNYLAVVLKIIILIAGETNAANFERLNWIEMFKMRTLQTGW